MRDPRAAGVFYSYQSGMRDRAIQLGHSLLFPTQCRYCRVRIWLFAAPDGGFAIFDEPGGEWPKHECWGVDQSTARYTEIAPRYSVEYSFPVPAGTPRRRPRHGSKLQGTVVRQEKSRTSRVSDEACVFDGKAIFTVLIPRGDIVGKCVRGLVQVKNKQPRLTKMQVVDGPPAPTARFWQGSRPSPTELQALRRMDIWVLQLYAETLKATAPRASCDLTRALDALLNDFALAGIFFLSRVATDSHQHLPGQLRGRLMRIIENALEAMRSGIMSLRDRLQRESRYVRELPDGMQLRGEFLAQWP